MTQTKYPNHSLRPVTILFFSLLSFFCLIYFHSPALAKSTFPNNTILAPGDTIQLQSRNQKLSKQLIRDYLISPSGNISITGIGTIHAAGKSVSTLKTEIQKALFSTNFPESKVQLSLLKQNRFFFYGEWGSLSWMVPGTTSCIN